jgi:hypothetical protein|tara:strand:+ start:2872 stop:3240 length:369 start_codon:yes stop_codon:yes gene_type:complete
MVKKITSYIKNASQKKVAWTIAIILTGIIVIGSIFGPGTKEVEANEDTSGYSTLPGWSAGYRYYFDMDEDEKSHIRLFSKYKQKDGNTFKLGWDRQTGKDMNQFDTNIDDDGVIFFEQEFKF